MAFAGLQTNALMAVFPLFPNIMMSAHESPIFNFVIKFYFWF